MKTTHLITHIYRTANTRKSTSERGGIAVLDSGKNILASATFEFSGMEHVEKNLLNKREIMDKLNEAHKVSLYTYFAPCPSCYEFLVHYPLTFRNAKWYLAYTALLPITAGYDRDTMLKNLANMHTLGWKIRQWSTSLYEHAPKKLGKLFTDKERTLEYPVGSGIFEEFVVADGK